MLLRERAARASHAIGARRRNGARERVSGSPRGNAPRKMKAGGRMIRTRVWLVVMMLACGGSAFAQDAAAPPPERIGLFAADVRVSFPNFKGPAEIATALGVDEHNLP